MAKLIDINLFEGPRVITKKEFNDKRGYSYELFKDEWSDSKFIQDNVSFSKKAGTVRGLHYQIYPFAQAKFVSVINGSIFDVIVDLRKTSNSFKDYFSIELSRENKKSLYVPRGFGHGFITLEESTIIIYKVDNSYAKESERSIRWDDEDLSIEWPYFEKYLLSERDLKAANFKDSLDELKF